VILSSSSAKPQRPGRSRGCKSYAMRNPYFPTRKRGMYDAKGNLRLLKWNSAMLAKPCMKPLCPFKRVLENSSCQDQTQTQIAPTQITPPRIVVLPSRKAAIHRILAVPTLALSPKQSLSHSGIALLLLKRHSCLKHIWVRKID
jgi:hypothetical protein